MTKEEKVKEMIDKCLLAHSLSFEDVITEVIEWGQQNPEVKEDPKENLSLLEGLKEYFKNTTKEQIQKDWDKTKFWDSIGISFDDFIENLKEKHLERLLGKEPQKPTYKLEPFDLEKAKKGAVIVIAIQGDSSFDYSFIGVTKKAYICIEHNNNIFTYLPSRLNIKTEVKPIVHEFWVNIFEKKIHGCYYSEIESNLGSKQHFDMMKNYGKFIRTEKFTITV